ncbi:MAG: sulfurtransferase [Holophagales bacterium]|nr:sulfurtransferase [Holophagales bacterium]
MRSSLRALDRFPLLLAFLAVALAPIARAAAAPKAPAAPAVVSGEWLQANLAAKDVVLLDARPMRDFLVAHLPGAQSVAVENLRSTSGGVPATTYPPEVLGVLFARAGVTSGSHVVVYGAESDNDATYVATAALIAGARKVSVLDGGFSRWTTEARATTKDRMLSPAARPGLQGDTSFLIRIDDVKKRVGDGRTVFLDVRPEESWAAGRIPGAKNRFWKKDVEGGSFRPEAATREELEAAGVSWEKPVVVYCNSGHQASATFYTLKFRLGHPDARLYQGSWLEWSMTPDAPRESSTPAEKK